MLMKAAFEGLEEVPSEVTANIGVIDGQLNGDDCDHFLHCYDEDSNRLSDAQHVVAAMEAISVPLCRVDAISDNAAGALNAAIESLCLTIGYTPGDRRIPKIDGKNVKASLESFRDTIRTIYERFMALLKHVAGAIADFFKRLLGANAANKVKAAVTTKAIHEHKAKVNPQTAERIEKKIVEDNHTAGVFVEDVMVEEIQDLDRKLTEGLNTPSAARPHGVHSAKLAHFFIGADGKAADFGIMFKTLDTTSKIIGAIGKIMASYAETMSAEFSKLEEAAPVKGAFMTFGELVQRELAPALSGIDVGAGMKAIANVRFNKITGGDLADNTWSFSALINFPLKNRFALSYDYSTNALVSTAHSYTDRSSVGSLVRLCPMDHMGELVGNIIKDGSASEHGVKEFDKRVSVVIAKMQHLLEQLRQEGEKSEDGTHSTEYVSQTTQHFHDGIKAISSMQVFYAKVIAYQSQLHANLLEWIDLSLAEYNHVEKELLAA